MKWYFRFSRILEDFGKVSHAKNNSGNSRISWRCWQKAHASRLNVGLASIIILVHENVFQRLWSCLRITDINLRQTWLRLRLPLVNQVNTANSNTTWLYNGVDMFNIPKGSTFYSNTLAVNTKVIGCKIAFFRKILLSHIPEMKKYKNFYIAFTTTLKMNSLIMW